MGKMWTEKKTLYLQLTSADKDDLINKINEATANAEGLKGDLEETTKQIKSAIVTQETIVKGSLRILGNGKMEKQIDVTFFMVPELKKVKAVMPDGSLNEKLGRDMTQKEIDDEAQLSLFPESAEGVVPAIVVEESEDDDGEVDTAATEGDSPDEEDQSPV